MSKQRTKKADKIDFIKVFIPEEDESGIPYRETLDWLEQYFPAQSIAKTTNRRIFLLVGDESYPEQIWSCKNNYYKATCYLEWQRQEE